MKRLSPAWLLDCGGGVMVAIGLSNVLHVVEDKSLLHRVPLAPVHCNRVLLWQKRILPAVDIATLVGVAAPAARASYACVLGWRDTHGVSEYGVLLIFGLPRQIGISDADQIRPANADADRWRGLALGFFSYHKRITPIIDPAALFGSVQQSTMVPVERVTHRSA